MSKGITVFLAVIAAMIMVVGAYAHLQPVIDPAEIIKQSVSKVKSDDNIEELIMVNADTGMSSMNKATFNRQTKEFKWTPAKNDAGNYQVRVTATDGKRTQTEIVKVKVAKPVK